MQDQSEKLLRFTETVLGQANRESEAMRCQMAHTRSQVLGEAREEAREAARAHYEREAAQIRAEAGREVSRHLMDIKRNVYLRRKEIGEEVFAKVRARLEEFTSSPEYPAYLEKLLKAAMKQVCGATTVSLRLRREDMQYAERLTHLTAPAYATCEEGNFSLGGLAIRCPELGLRVDCTFDNRLNELSSRFAESFGLSLSDDLDEM